MRYQPTVILAIICIATANPLRAQIPDVVAIFNDQMVEPLPTDVLVDRMGPGWTHTITLSDTQKAAIQALLEKYQVQAARVHEALAKVDDSVSTAQFAKIDTVEKKYHGKSPQALEASKVALKAIIASRAPYKTQLARLAAQERAEIAAVLTPTQRQEYLWYAEIGDSLPTQLRYIKLTETQRTAITPIGKRFLTQINANKQAQMAVSEDSADRWDQLSKQEDQIIAHFFGECRVVLMHAQLQVYDENVRRWLVTTGLNINTIPGIKP